MIKVTFISPVSNILFTIDFLIYKSYILIINILILYIAIFNFILLEHLPYIINILNIFLLK